MAEQVHRESHDVDPGGNVVTPTVGVVLAISPHGQILLPIPATQVSQQ